MYENWLTNDENLITIEKLIDDMVTGYRYYSRGSCTFVLINNDFRYKSVSDVSSYLKSYGIIALGIKMLTVSKMTIVLFDPYDFIKDKFTVLPNDVMSLKDFLIKVITDKL